VALFKVIILIQPISIQAAYAHTGGGTWNGQKRRDKIGWCVD
jgi:hypothetical protein